MNKIKKLIMTLMCTLMCTSAVMATNVVTVPDISCYPGKETSLEISLANSEILNAVQVNIPLPEDVGISIVEDSAKGIGRAADFSVSAGIKDNNLTLMVYSLTMEEIAPGDRTILSVKLSTSDTPYSGYLTPSVIATGINDEKMECSISSFRFENLVPRFVLRNERIDFGRVPIKSEYSRRVTISNTGTAPLVISGVRFSASTLKLQDSLPLTIAAGQSSTLTINYSPLKRGEVLETIVFECNSTSSRNLLEISAIPFAVNELTVKSASGIAGEEATISLTLTNMDPVTGFTLEFTMPDELQYVENSFQLNSLRRTDHAIIANLEGNKLMVNCYSLTDAPFNENAGEIASFKVILNGRYGANLTLDKAIFAAVIDGEITNVTSDIYGTYISILAPIINVDRSVSLGRTPIIETTVCAIPVYNGGSAPLKIDRVLIDTDSEYFECLNITNSFPLTINSYDSAELILQCDGLYEGEISGAVQIYCNDPESELVNIEFKGERYAPNFITGTSKNHKHTAGTAWLDFALSNYDAITGLQFDLIYNSEYFKPLDNAEFTDRANDFSVQRREISTDCSRYFVYSLSGKEISSGDGDIMRLPFSFNEDIPLGQHNFTITNMVISTSEMSNKNSAINDHNFNLLVEQDAQTGVQEYKTSDFRIEVYGNYLRILGVKTNEMVKIFNLSGRMLHSQKGDGEVNNLEKGIYILQKGRKTYKVIIP